MEDTSCTMKKSSTKRRPRKKKDEKKKEENKKKKYSRKISSCFHNLFNLIGDFLGQGAYASVQTCISISTKQQFAVKIIEKVPFQKRKNVLREVETLYHCKDHPNIIQLHSFFEDSMKYYLVFEKVKGGTLLKRMLKQKIFTEYDASLIIKDLTTALLFMHSKGIAHRDLKPDNILCVYPDKISPVKICDFDLSSGIQFTTSLSDLVTSPRLISPVGSVEYMAPEIVEGFEIEAFPYDKRCDLWSLGVVMYLILCGYPPFYGKCGSSCQWDKGGFCDVCQTMLFIKIQDCDYTFPDEEWSTISEEAKDLVQSLLHKDAFCRPSAADILNHPWITKNISGEHTNANPLRSPQNLRKNSVKRMSDCTESAMETHRVYIQHSVVNSDFLELKNTPAHKRKKNRKNKMGENNSNTGNPIEDDKAKAPFELMSPCESSLIKQRKARKQKKNPQN